MQATNLAGETPLDHANLNDHEQVACLMFMVTGRVDRTNVDKM